MFYAGRPVTRCSGDPAAGRSARQQLAEFLARHEHASYVITSNEDEREINKAFPGVFQVIFRQRRFLELESSESSEMVVLRASREK